MSSLSSLSRRGEPSTTSRLRGSTLIASRRLGCGRIMSVWRAEGGNLPISLRSTCGARVQPSFDSTPQSKDWFLTQRKRTNSWIRLPAKNAYGSTRGTSTHEQVCPTTTLKRPYRTLMDTNQTAKRKYAIPPTVILTFQLGDIDER